jgi:hypothetical protein
MAMEAKFPQFQCHLFRNTGIWIGLLQPTPRSPQYTVRIKYTLKRYPRITVVDPPLELAEGKKFLPHTYQPDNRLCLYFPPSGQWSSNKLLADHIVPWISEWLYYYEIWVFTGKWLGGGIEHNGPKEER